MKCGILIWAVVFPILTAVLQAQSPPPAGQPPAEIRELGQPQATVEIEQPSSDDDIAKRLEEILISTERFTKPHVRVHNGVVFLSGTTRVADHKIWAKELALKTRDVVAVVNNIEVEESPLWNFAPARQELRTLWRQIVQGLPLFLIGLVILAVTLLLGRTIARSLGKTLTKRIESDILRSIAEKGILIGVVLVGVYVFLRVSGLTQVAITLVGGTGLAGLIFGFAFRDIAENFLASVLMSVQKPFRIGDTIEVAGQTGVVQKVTTRGTVLIDFDGNYIQLSNATVYKSTIRNFTANPNVRIDFTVGFGFDHAIAHAQEIILRILNEHSAVLKEPEPMVLVEQLGGNVTLRVLFWIDGHKHSKFKVKSAVMRLTVQAMQNEGILGPAKGGEPAREKSAEAAPATAKPARRAAARHQEFAEATRAEGDLSSEVETLHKQAEQSSLPEESATLMDSHTDAAVRT